MEKIVKLSKVTILANAILDYIKRKR